MSLNFSSTAKHSTRPIVTDVPLVTSMSPTKTAEPIEVPFAIWARGGGQETMHLVVARITTEKGTLLAEHLQTHCKA